MYEVIWSHFYDKHIVRKVTPLGSVEALAFGTEEECKAFVQKLAA